MQRSVKASSLHKSQALVTGRTGIWLIDSYTIMLSLMIVSAHLQGPWAWPCKQVGIHGHRTMLL